MFSDCEDNTARKNWGRYDTTSWRRPSQEEIKALTVATIEQANNNYNMRNRVVNHDQGKLASMFIKEKGTKENKNGGAPKMTLTQQTPITPQVETPKISTPPVNSFDITNALSQMKIFVPHFEIMRILEYKNSVLS